MIRMNPECHRKCRCNREAEALHRQEDSVTVEAEIGRMEPPAKECLQPPKAGRAGYDRPLVPPVGPRPC